MANFPQSLPSLALSLFILLSVTSASILTITIPPSNALPNPHSLPASTHATLTTLTSSQPRAESSAQSQWPLKAILTRSSTLVFPSLPSTPASYLLDIHSRNVVFAPYRVDVGSDGNVLGVWETFRGQAWGHKGPEKAGSDVTPGSGSGGGKDVVFEARAIGARKFYEERSQFSPLSLFKNPMILLGVFALAVTFGMPYLMDNLDPEMREEFQRQRTGAAGGGGAGGAAAPPAMPGSGFDFAGWMAGTSPGPMDAASKATTSGRDGGQAPSARRR